MTKLIALIYGAACYVLFLGTMLYTFLFIEDWGVSRTIDSGKSGPLWTAIVTDLMLLGLFALQHSVMARQQFKAWWTRLVPRAVERSTYVLFTDLALILLLWQWRPIPAVLWHVENPAVALFVTLLSLAGWGLLLLSSFLIDHFELAGVKQVIDNLSGRVRRDGNFRAPFLYKFVRHPLYLGFLIAFWAAPLMTAGHFLFAAAMTAYIFIGIALEERDLVAHFGDTYRDYRARVSMIVPLRPKKLAPGK